MIENIREPNETVCKPGYEDVSDLSLLFLSFYFLGSFRLILWK